MKKFKYIFCSIILLSAYGLYAQTPVLVTYSLANPNHELRITEKGSYSKDFANERDQYVGRWQYNQNGVFFEIKMEKKDQHLFETPYNYFYIDVILIRYRLIKNGIETSNNYTSNDPDVLSEGTKQGGDDYLNCSFLDVTRQVRGVVSIKKLTGTPQKIIFNLYTGGYSLFGPPEMYQPGADLFSVPTGPIEMVKVD